MAKKVKHPEHVNHERWLISYADFITLLFAFFTSMYAISTVDARKAGQLVFSTRAAFNMDFFPTDKPTLGSSERATDPLDPRQMKIVPPKEAQQHTADARTLRMRQLEGVAKQIEIMLGASTLRNAVKVRRDNGNLVVSLADAAFFESGRSTIRPKSLAAFHKIAAALVQTKQAMRVEGHTDDQPVGRGPFRSNLELSAARAASVVMYLSQEFAYPPESMSIAGFASNRPVASNDTAEGRAQNRRVDIVLMANDTAVSQVAPSSPPPAKAVPGDEPEDAPATAAEPGAPKPPEHEPATPDLQHSVVPEHEQH